MLSKIHKMVQYACGVLQKTREQHAYLCRNILAVVGPPGSGKSALVAAMCGRLYKPAKATGKIMISGREAYESFKPTWFSANDVLTSHLTVHQYLLYKGVCPSQISCHAPNEDTASRNCENFRASCWDGTRQFAAQSWQCHKENKVSLVLQCSCDRLGRTLWQCCTS